MHSADDDPALPTANEADAAEQQLPAVPGAQEDTDIQGPLYVHGDPLRQEGSQADRLDQNVDAGEVDAEDEEYPKRAAGHE